MEGLTAKRVKVPGGYHFTHHNLDIDNWIFVPIFWVTEHLQMIARWRHRSPLSDEELRSWIAGSARGGIVPLVKFAGKNHNGIFNYHPNATDTVLLDAVALRTDEWHVPAGVRTQALYDFDCHCIDIAPPRIPLRKVWQFLPSNYFQLQPLDILELEASLQHMLEHHGGFKVVGDLCCMTEAGMARLVGAEYSVVRSALRKFGLGYRDKR